MNVPTINISKYAALASLLLVLFAPHLSAATMPDPSAEAIRSVYGYFQSGSRPIVSQNITCARIGDTQPDRFECLDSVDISKPVPAYSGVYHWVSLFVPTPFSGAVEYRFFHKDGLVKSSRVTVSSSMRYRVWKLIPTNQSGEWKIEIVSISDDGKEASLLSTNYTVE